jgi:poly(rC)-binding protein 2/3/4
MSPAMNAAIKIFKHINEIEEINSDGTLSASASDICSVRLLVPFEQAVHLIGKQGVTIKSIEESTGTTVRIRDEGMLLSNSIQIVQLKGCIHYWLIS